MFLGIFDLKLTMVYGVWSITVWSMEACKGCKVTEKFDKVYS